MDRDLQPSQTAAAAGPVPVRRETAARRLLRDIMTSGTHDRFNTADRNRIIFLNAVSYVGVVVMFVFSTVAFLAGKVPLGLSTLIAGTLVLIILTTIRRFHYFKTAGWLITLLMAVLYGYLVMSGGESGSGILWIQAFPLIAMFLISTVPGTVLSFLFLGFVAVNLFVPELNKAGFSHDYAYRVIGTYTYVWLFGLIYDIIRRATQDTLQQSNEALSRTTEALGMEKQQTDGILKNVQDGIFLMDSKLVLGAAHSRHLEDIFGRSGLTGETLPDLLRPILAERDLQAALDWLPMLFGSAVNPVLLAEINPLAEVKARFFGSDGAERLKYLRFTFTPVNLREGETSVLGVVRDVTDEIELQQKLDQEAARHRQSMEKLFQVIHVDPKMMTEFIRDTESELDGINTLLRDQGTAPAELMPHMYQAVHGIKGNALLLGLNELARKVHDLEEQIRPFLSKDCSWKELLSLTLGLGMIQGELEEITGLIGKILSFQQSSSENGLADHGLLERTISRLVERESQRLGKSARLAFDGFDSRVIPEERRKLVKDVLVQLLRNSLVHGVEAPDQRAAAGKSEEGTITLAMSLEPGFLRFSCRDDGRGLDLEAIRAKAAEMPGADPAVVAALGPKELSGLIFQTGFSTAAATDLGAGRGAGMALVKERVKAAGGTVRLSHKAGAFCEISFTVPVELQ